MMIFPLSSSIWGSLLEMMDEVSNEYMGTFSDIAVTLAAMLAAFTIVKTSTSYIEGDNNFGWSLIRPIVILLCVMNFSSIFDFFDYLVCATTSKIADASDSSFADLIEIIENSTQVTGTSFMDKVKEAWGETGGAFKKIIMFLYDTIVNAIKTMCKLNAITGISFWAFLSKLLSELIFVVMEILAAAYLTLMRIMGPFIVALAIPQIWKNNIPSLVSRYIQISLWVPVGYVIITILTTSTKCLMKLITESGLFVSAGSTFFGLALLLTTVSLTGSIPKICSWIIESTGAAGAQDSLFNFLKKITKMH